MIGRKFRPRFQPYVRLEILLAVPCELQHICLARTKRRELTLRASPKSSLNQFPFFLSPVKNNLLTLQSILFLNGLYQINFLFEKTIKSCQPLGSRLNEIWACLVHAAVRHNLPRRNRGVPPRGLVGAALLACRSCATSPQAISAAKPCQSCGALGAAVAAVRRVLTAAKQVSY